MNGILAQQDKSDSTFYDSFAATLENLSIIQKERAESFAHPFDYSELNKDVPKDIDYDNLPNELWMN